LIAAWLLFSGCAHESNLKKGVTVRLENLTIHFMGEDEQFIGQAEMEQRGIRILGQSWPKASLILMPGRVKKNGDIIYDMEILGHELGHLLHDKNNKVIDPHGL
jgi:hypothetical protein